MSRVAGILVDRTRRQYRWDGHHRRPGYCGGWLERSHRERAM